MKRVVVLMVLLMVGRVGADVTFTFQESGGTVTMTSSGVLDTTKLVSVDRFFQFGGAGTENYLAGTGNFDVMGGNYLDNIDALFAYHSGTDVSAIHTQDAEGGPFAFSTLSLPTFAGIVGSKSFATYSGFDVGFLGDDAHAGISVVSSDISNGLWTPDQKWTYRQGDTLASLGLNIGTYSVSDAVTGETVTIQVIPEPSSAVLIAIVGGLGLFVRRRFLIV